MRTDFQIRHQIYLLSNLIKHCDEMIPQYSTVSEHDVIAEAQAVRAKALLTINVLRWTLGEIEWERVGQ